MIQLSPGAGISIHTRSTYNIQYNPTERYTPGCKHQEMYTRNLDLKTLQWWISRSMLDLLVLLIPRLG